MTVSLDTPLVIRNHIIKNRIACAPLADIRISFDPREGMNDGHVEFYASRARGGAGMVVTGTLMVDENKSGVFYGSMPGLWRDEQAIGLQKIASGCHRHGALVLAQLGTEGTQERYSERELYELEDAFISAALRARKAGCDGVEIHAAHGWLLSLLVDPAFNDRNDAFGGCFANRMRFLADVIRGIRLQCGKDFVVECRVAGSIPDLSGAVVVSRDLERLGVDILHVSFGPSPYSTLPPDGFPLDFVCYGGTKIHEAVGIPVMCVSGITTADKAHFLIGNGLCDMVAIGRSMLVNSSWAQEVLAGRGNVVGCMGCRDVGDCYGLSYEANPCPVLANK